MSKTEQNLTPADFGHSGLGSPEHEQAVIDSYFARRSAMRAKLPAVSSDENFDAEVVRGTLEPTSAYATAKNRLDLARTAIANAKKEEAKNVRSFEAHHSVIEQELYDETDKLLDQEDARDRELHP